jgi:hypothetical protein
MLGGYGNLGARTVRVLRRLHPDLPILIAGRDLAKAEALAGEIGLAKAATVDIGRADLGLPAALRPSVVVTALKDHGLATMRYAQAHRVPYLALSDAAFELGPLVARYVHEPHGAPIVMLGHSMGAVPVLAALHLAGGFQTVDAIEIGLVFDPGDPFGATSASDMERIAETGPAPLLLRDGRWRWAGEGEAMRRFTGVGGAEHQGRAAGLVDVLSLAAATGARSIRLDGAEGATASSRRGEGPSHEVIVELSGVRANGSAGRDRWEMVDADGYAALSARGIAMVVERMLGLLGGPPPGVGLYLPELLLDPGLAMRRLESLGVGIRQSQQAADMDRYPSSRRASSATQSTKARSRGRVSLPSGATA